MKNKKNIEVFVVYKPEDVQGVCDWCECNDHKVLEIEIITELNGLEQNGEDQRQNGGDRLASEAQNQAGPVAGSVCGFL